MHPFEKRVKSSIDGLMGSYKRVADMPDDDPKKTAINVIIELVGELSRLQQERDAALKNSKAK